MKDKDPYFIKLAEAETKAHRTDELYFLKLTKAEVEMLNYILYHAGFTHSVSNSGQASVHDVILKVEHALYHQ